MHRQLPLPACFASADRRVVRDPVWRYLHLLHHLHRTERLLPLASLVAQADDCCEGDNAWSNSFADDRSQAGQRSFPLRCSLARSDGWVQILPTHCPSHSGFSHGLKIAVQVLVKHGNSIFPRHIFVPSSAGAGRAAASKAWSPRRCIYVSGRKRAAAPWSPRCIHVSGRKGAAAPWSSKCIHISRRWSAPPWFPRCIHIS
mmetsp:Transcript_60979/g.145310  ORF Transcript_60979/g.145310 Transcript_60979/m.145310 type:complete len:201 (-) Transcript_60979:254-856(-)